MKRRVLIKTSLDGYRVTTPEGEVTGGAVIRELSHDAACIPVFQVLRLVTTWAMERPQRRPGLLPNDRVERLLGRIAGKLPFRAGDPRGALACILGEITAADPDVRRAAFACLGVADWALSQGAIDTALSYARAAALVKPDARYAWISGRMHREHGRLEEAEVWFKVAYSIAGRTRDWPVRVRSLLSSGHAYMLAGNYLVAREQFSRALGIARRRKVSDRIGEAHHYLFIIAATTGDHATAAAESHAALRGYGPKHERLPHFAHDLARYWMDRGAYPQAEHVLDALLKHHFRDEPAARLLTVGSVLRAAGGAQDSYAFDRYLPELQELGVRASTTPSHAQAFLAAGFGAVALRRWVEAGGLVSTALVSAQQTHQRDTEVEAAGLLDAISDERNVVHAESADSTIQALADDTLLYLSGDPVLQKV